MIEPTVWDPTTLVGVDSPAPAELAEKYRDESEHTIWVHEELYSWLIDEAEDPRQKRARYCLRELLTTGQCARRKNVQGAAKGWVRTQLGGTGGSHFYLWWAPYGYPAVEGTDLEPGEILVRAVRHHDDTDKPLDPGGRDASWHVFRAEDAHDHDDSDLNEQQQAVAAMTGAPIRIVRGHPGSGKTTALQQAASHVWGDRALYLTFSNRLAQESARYLRTFAPQGTTVDSLTFGELIAEFSDEPDVPRLPGANSRGVTRLAEHLKIMKGQLGPWAGRYGELFAELHAHALGRAVPVDFRGMPASLGPVVGADALVADRSEVIGVEASEKLAFVAGKLAELDLLDELFPDIRAARRLVDRSSEPLPTRFDGVSAVFVDEVQDLTVVEAMLVLTVIARIAAASGRMPQLFIAGDEAQTVRPTAFGWDWLNELITWAFGDNQLEREKIALTTNMRSSKAVSAVIEATRSHYKILEKDLRPGGQPYDPADAETDGKVLYCHLPDADVWDDLGRLFVEHSSAQLVYPGPSVPDEFTSSVVDVAASEQVKGLDFDLVGVVAAGACQLELEALAAKADDDRLAGALGRTIADQFRVAVSRSRENLLLLDRGPESRLEAIRGLMAEADADPVRPVEPDSLRAELADDADPVDRLDSQLAAVDEILESEPERALQKARIAADYLAHIAGDHEVPGPLAEKASRLLGLAAALVATVRTAEGDQADAEALRDEASAAFDIVGLSGVFTAVRAFVGAATATTRAQLEPSAALAAVRALGTVREDLGLLEPQLRASLVNWMDAVAGAGFVRGVGLEDSLLAAEELVDALPTRPELVDRRRDALLVTAEAADAAGEYEGALRCYEELDAPFDVVGPVLEELGWWRRAADLYESSGDQTSQLRCLRQIPDIERAIEVAEEIEPALVGRLRWARALESLVSEELTDQGAPLTEGERVHLEAALTSGLERVVDSVPVDGAPVDDFGAPTPIAPDASVIETEPADIEPAVDVPELDEPEPQPPALPEEPASSVGADAPTATVPVVEDDSLVDLADLAGELSIDLGAASAVCRKLGIRPVGEQLTLSPSQAGRLRRRVGVHGLD